MRSLCISSHKYSFNCVCEDVSWCYAFPRRLRQQRPCCTWHSSQMASFSEVALQKHKLQSDSCLVKWQTLKVDQKYNIWCTHTGVTSHLKPTFQINFLCCMLNWFKLNIQYMTYIHLNLNLLLELLFKQGDLHQCCRRLGTCTAPGLDNQDSYQCRYILVNQTYKC